MCLPDLDSQKWSEEWQIIVELVLVEHAHLRRTFRASFMRRTMADKVITIEHAYVVMTIQA